MSYSIVFLKTDTPNNSLANFASLFLQSNLGVTESIVSTSLLLSFFFSSERLLVEEKHASVKVLQTILGTTVAAVTWENRIDDNNNPFQSYNL